MEDAVYDRLVAGFGTHVHHWPDIPRQRPRWWQRAMIKKERRINAVLATIGKGPITDRMREIFWTEVRKGQDYREDAGGYILRCWSAALGFPYQEAIFTYSGYRAPDFDWEMFHGKQRGF